MLLVLDSNEYIFAFGLLKEQSCKNLIDSIEDRFPSHTIRIPRTIVEEVRAHLTRESFKEFITFVNALTTIDEDILVPFEIGARYEVKGFKPADAFISAYVEYIGADALVTENRHFLSCQEKLSFRVVTAEEILPEL